MAKGAVRKTSRRANEKGGAGVVGACVPRCIGARGGRIIETSADDRRVHPPPTSPVSFISALSAAFSSYLSVPP